jgi:hypothetical protein
MRGGRHDPLVLILVAVAVIDVGHRRRLVIGDPVHRVAAEAESGDPCQAGAPQIMRRDALDPMLGDNLLEQRGRRLGNGNASSARPRRDEVPAEDKNSSRRDQVMATGVELTIRLGVLGLLLYWSFFLIHPFITIAIWSVVLTVALYPVYDWIVDRLGGRRRLAAALLTLINLLIVIGPATWLALGLIDSLRTLSDRLDLSILELPPPPLR